jgi:aspartyl-tRNA(Asn)/glutamyl-tRNA(Gln) amidotransferase subunit B
MVKIGLEVHGYLDTREKLFCMCRTGVEEGNDEPNSRICPICTGTPGSKPMAVNLEAVRKMIQIALVFKSKINMEAVWQRKHYDWADLPKGFQTTMSGPHASVNAKGGRFKGINIWELHLEEDPAQWNPDSGRVDYNRSGLPLIEMVTAPEFSDSEQVVEWLKALVLSLSYIKAVRKNAGIKVDVNVSVGGERVEMKNLNSLEKIRKAIDYEIARQTENNEKGVVQVRETRAYDESKGVTIKMRSKEDAADYRFVPCPDLAVLKVSKKMVNEIRGEMPEMPEVKLERLLKTHKVSAGDAKILTRNLELVDFFEELVNVAQGKEKIKPRTSADERGLDVKRVISWVTVELLRVLNYNKKSLEDADVNIRPEHLAELIGAVEAGEITVLKGKQIMNDFVPRSFSLAEHKGEVSSIDEAAVENLCQQVISENAHVVAEYKEGKAASLNFLIGGVMRLSERRADFRQAGDCLKRLIG